MPLSVSQKHGRETRMRKDDLFMKKKTMTVFVCSPYRGDVEGNVKRARGYAKFIAGCGYVPIIPHLFYPTFLSDDDAEERILGITLGVEQMKGCDEFWMYGTHISEGMAFELEKAREFGIPVRLYDRDGNRIEPATLMIDDRCDSEYRKAVYGLRFV